MKNITVLAIAWVVWFCVCWWFAGIDVNPGRDYLLFVAGVSSFSGLVVATSYLTSEGQLFKKFGELDD